MAGVLPFRQHSFLCRVKSPSPPFAKGGEGGFRHSIAALSCLLLLSLLALAAVTQRPAQAQTPHDEAEAQAIDRMLMCPVCPGETIDQSQVELARQMRLRVREMLAQGAGRQQVLDFFVARYGVEILAAPPKSGFNLVAWIFPALAVPLALAGGLLALRAMRRRPAAELAPVPGPDVGLDPFLARVDQELTVAAPSDVPRTGSSADG
ncbi:MAG: cytochrome c-type biogenesis protein CcmH [Dehalococcoidia bacterium]|nr:cytochrome c-type biogenesis protein CcmH [Dehalococcoidia bacterium]MSQ16593.1 cytochrome c-type biogenesis protein CcmH [Dehalococcoidia bacterium]